MLLKDIYKLYDIDEGIYNCKDTTLEGSKYPFNIVLEFDGEAEVKVYIGSVCIEEHKSFNGCILDNFRDVSYPYELHPFLRIHVSTDFVITYKDIRYPRFIRELIKCKHIAHPLAEGSKYKYLLVKFNKLELANEKRKLKVEIDFDAIDENYVAVESYDWKLIVENAEFTHLEKYLVLSYGYVYDYKVMCDLQLEIPPPTMIFPLRKLKKIMPRVEKCFPKAEFLIGMHKPSNIIMLNKDTVHKLLRYYIPHAHRIGNLDALASSESLRSLGSISED
jgi:hypothetical protein